MTQSKLKWRQKRNTALTRGPEALRPIQVPPGVTTYEAFYRRYIGFQGQVTAQADDGETIIFSSPMGGPFAASGAQRELFLEYMAPEARAEFETPGTVVYRLMRANAARRAGQGTSEALPDQDGERPSALSVVLG